MLSYAPQHAAKRWASCALALAATLCLTGCIIMAQPAGPPSALKGVSSVAVQFDYTGLLVSGMGSAKTEAEWVAVKTAEDPEYGKTWADLKAKWEEHYFAALSGSSSVPVTRTVHGEVVRSEVRQVLPRKAALDLAGLRTDQKRALQPTETCSSLASWVSPCWK